MVGTGVADYKVYVRALLKVKKNTIPTKVVIQLILWCSSLCPLTPVLGSTFARPVFFLRPVYHPACFFARYDKPSDSNTK